MTTRENASDKPSVPNGAWVTMITPFTTENQIDWQRVDELVEFFIAAGLDGIFAVCLSSEMYQLSAQERLTLAKRVVDTAKGRIPVIASGSFDATMADQAAFIKQMYNTGVEAVVLIASMICQQTEDDMVFKNNLSELLRHLKDHPVPLGLYECPEPYHRVLSAETLRWVVQTGSFFVFKDTSRSMENKRQKIEMLKELRLQNNPHAQRFKWMSANMCNLFACLKLGGDGYCGIAANCYPEPIAMICKDYASNNAHDMEMLQKFLTVSEQVIAHKYPQSAKQYLRHFVKGFSNMEAVSRKTNFQFNEEELLALEHVRDCIHCAMRMVVDRKPPKP